jgi:hypothetical protein
LQVIEKLKNTSLANSTVVSWVSEKASTIAAIVSGSCVSVMNGLPVNYIYKIMNNI